MSPQRLQRGRVVLPWGAASPCGISRSSSGPGLWMARDRFAYVTGDSTSPEGMPGSAGSARSRRSVRAPVITREDRHCVALLRHALHAGMPGFPRPTVFIIGPQDL